MNLLLRLLPLEYRARYREEVAADLATLHGRARSSYVLGFTLALPALWLSLHSARIGIDGHKVRLRCRLGMHHWHTQYTEDNKRYRRCDRCGKDDDLGGQPSDGLAVAASAYRTTQ